MARSFLRAHGPTETPPGRTCPSFRLLLVPTLVGCVAHRPAPLVLSDLLAELEAVEVSLEESADPDRGALARQLARFAVEHNPSLAALRAGVGVAGAQLVQAGLWSDPQVGWDGMDALAATVVEGEASRVDVLAGLGLQLQLPRPGEIDAREGVARWRLEEARRLVLEAEWRLALEVHLAVEDLREARILVDQNRELVAIARATREWFDRARGAGSATAVQASLARGDQFVLEAETVRLEANARAARHRLNALLGVPPTTELDLADPGREPVEGPDEDVDGVLAGALEQRPDLAALLAAYGAAEEAVRLEVAGQFPRLTLGTGIWFQPGLLTRFNRPAIAEALARREELARRVRASVHEVRRELLDVLAGVGESRKLLDVLEGDVLRNAEENLELARAAFEVGEIPLMEVLTLQRALVEARTTTTRTRAELRRRGWRLLAASGRLLGEGEDRGQESVR